MKTNVSYYDFRAAFQAYDRIGQFTYEGLQMLYEFLIEMEDDTGVELELDVIAICCDFCEDIPADIANNYRISEDALRNCSETVKTDIIEVYLQENTIYVGKTDVGTMLYTAF